MGMVDVPWHEHYESLRESVLREVDDAKVSAAMAEMVIADVEKGLVHGIVSDREGHARLIQLLQSLSYRDGFARVSQLLTQLINERFARLVDWVRSLAVSLLSMLIAKNASGVEAVVLSLVRQLAGNSTVPLQSASVGAMVEMLEGHMEWMLTRASPKTIVPVAYVLLRLTADYSTMPELSALRVRLGAIAVKIIKGRSEECASIGRDLVRAVAEVADHSEVRDLWSRMISNQPTDELAVGQLTSRKTSRHCLSLRLPGSMEKHIRFLLSEVRMGNQKRYQTWFARKWLSGPETEFMIPDLLRYICCVFHPPTHIINSDVVPRWAIVGWLLHVSLIKNKGRLAETARFAVLYDFYFYQDNDNIMNIEPAALLMKHSIPKYKETTATLLTQISGYERLPCRTFHLENVEDIRCHIVAAFLAIRNRRVVRSLHLILDSQTMPAALMTCLQDNFHEIFEREQKRPAEGGEAADDGVHAPATKLQRLKEPGSHGAGNALPNNGNQMSKVSPTLHADVESREGTFAVGINAGSPIYTGLSNFEKALRADGPESAKSHASLMELLTIVRKVACNYDDLANRIMLLMGKFGPSAREDLFPPVYSKTILRLSKSTIKGCILCPFIESRDSRLLMLVRALHGKKSVGCIGSYLLMHACALSRDKDQGGASEAFKSYKMYASLNMPQRVSVETFLRDLKRCAEWHPYLFLNMIPAVLYHMQPLGVGWGAVIKLIVYVIDPVVLASLCAWLRENDVAMFSDKVDHIIEMLKWCTRNDAFCVQAMWELLAADTSHAPQHFIEKIVERCARELDPEFGVSGLSHLLRDRIPSESIVKAWATIGKSDKEDAILLESYQESSM